MPLRRVVHRTPMAPAPPCRQCRCPLRDASILFDAKQVPSNSTIDARGTSRASPRIPPCQPVTTCRAS